MGNNQLQYTDDGLIINLHFVHGMISMFSQISQKVAFHENNNHQ